MTGTNNDSPPPNAGESVKLPHKAVDIEQIVSQLEDSRSKHVENLNKPILTIAPSSIAATIAFVGAVSTRITFDIWASCFLLLAWASWLLAIMAILLNYVFRIKAVKGPLDTAKMFSQIDFDDPNVTEDIQRSILGNHSLFEADKKTMNLPDRLQLAAPWLFACGFIAVFCFLINVFLFK